MNSKYSQIELLFNHQGHKKGFDIFITAHWLYCYSKILIFCYCSVLKKENRNKRLLISQNCLFSIWARNYILLQIYYLEFAKFMLPFVTYVVINLGLDFSFTLTCMLIFTKSSLELHKIKINMHFYYQQEPLIFRFRSINKKNKKL